MNKKQEKLIYHTLALVIGTPAWIWLFIQDWKIALGVLLVMFANNLTNLADKI